MSLDFFRCPLSKKELSESAGFLSNTDNKYPIMEIGKIKIIDFSNSFNDRGSLALALKEYDSKESREFYQNYLQWLCETFGTSDEELKDELISRINPRQGDNILITGCGLGSEIISILKQTKNLATVCAMDISHKMIQATLETISEYLNSVKNASSPSIILFIGDANNLPIKSSSFDKVFHFGGINLFEEMRVSIAEMDRLCKDGGKVVFGDEGVAHWLRETEYGKMAIENNKLYESFPPLKDLPQTCKNVKLEWVLGNCFYLISFNSSKEMPYMNPDIIHKSPRGGSMKTRYFGKLEGIDPTLKKDIISYARIKGISVVDWMSEAFVNQIMKEKGN